MPVRYLLLPVALVFATAAADTPPITALAQLQPGRWMLTANDPDFSSHAICLGDPKALLQIRQPIASCTRLVVTNDPKAATVAYSCPGGGSGRTTVRVETPRLAQVQTQGIAGGSPFDLKIEARRTGDCPALSMR